MRLIQNITGATRGSTIDALAGTGTRLDLLGGNTTAPVRRNNNRLQVDPTGEYAAAAAMENGENERLIDDLNTLTGNLADASDINIKAKADVNVIPPWLKALMLVIGAGVVIYIFKKLRRR